MAIVKTQEHIKLIRFSCRVLGNLLLELKTIINPGVSLIKIDNFVENYIRDNGGVPSFKGFHGFPNAACISVNEVVIHGIPSKYILKEGDIVGVDVGMNYKGGFGDTAYTYAVGRISDEKKRLLDFTEKSLFLAIDQAVCGNRVGDISFAVQRFIESKGYSLVREYSGHGLGGAVWEEPSIPNIGKKGLGLRLSENMVLAIEPMVNLGKADIYVKSDQWSVVTKDHKPSAHFEHSILITGDGPEILTYIS